MMSNLHDKGLSIPLWLDIKIEYIDENIDRVIDYLHEGVLHQGSLDSFYSRTVALLGQRVDLLLDEISSQSISTEIDDEQILEKQIRLLGTYLLLHDDNEDSKARHAYSVVLSRLLFFNPDISRELTELVLENFIGRTDINASDLPFSWDDMDCLKVQILAHKILGSQKFNRRADRDAWLDRQGTLHIDNGRIEIFPEHRLDIKINNLVSSLDLCDGLIQFFTPKGERLKQSDSNDMECIEEFTRNFILGQKNLKSKPVSYKKSYSNGARLEVVVTGKSNGKIHVRTRDKDFETISGTLVDVKTSIFYDNWDFLKFLKIGDCIEVELIDSMRGMFDVSSTFTEFIVKEYAEIGQTLNAKICNIKPDRTGHRKAYLWTEDGYPAQAYLDEEYGMGDVVEIRISDFGQGQYFGVIMSEIKSLSDINVVLEEESKARCIGSFLYAESAIEEEFIHEETVNEGELRELCRMLANYQKSLPQTASRYKVLCGLQIICQMMSWERDFKYVSLLADYLVNLVFFVKGKYEQMSTMKIPEMFNQMDSIKRKQKIISVLMSYGRNDRNSILSEAAESDDLLIRKIAVLILSSNSIGTFLNKSMLNVIKREITSSLSLDDEGDNDLDTENGIYLGLEGEHQEFKTSFFFAPKDAHEQIQKLTIFKGVCAFLNSRNGGTLYLGVDDLGYVKGIESELQQLEKIGCGNYHGIDGYIRYITDEAKKYFELDVLTHIKITSMYDGNVIALNVSPYEYGVVELEGRAYIRLNNESVVMNSAARKKILADKVNMNSDSSLARISLMKAISEKRKVILHGYSSSNGGDIRDRNVEPFAFAYGYQAIWCYDLEDDKCKVFKIDRISNVQILDERWSFEYAHKKLNMDIFRMSGETPIHVKLQLNLMAKNILVEEYEGADKVILPTKDDDVWILDTDVYKMEGVGRFYIGLANSITILDAPELEQYVRQFSAKYLNR